MVFSSHGLVRAASAKPPHRSTTVSSATRTLTAAPTSAPLARLASKAGRRVSNFPLAKPCVLIVVLPRGARRMAHRCGEREDRNFSLEDVAVARRAHRDVADRHTPRLIDRMQHSIGDVDRIEHEIAYAFRIELTLAALALHRRADRREVVAVLAEDADDRFRIDDALAQRRCRHAGGLDRRHLDLALALGAQRVGEEVYRRLAGAIDRGTRDREIAVDRRDVD